MRYSAGSPWGVRQEQLTGRRLAAGLDFAIDVPGDCWDDLAWGLVVGEANLSDVADGIVTSRLWIERVTASAKSQGMTWLHALIVAIAELDEGENDAASVLVERSLSLRQTWLGLRLKALLSADAEEAISSYLDAWKTGDAPPELAVEIAKYLMQADRPDDLKLFVKSLPPEIRDNERIVLARAVIAANERQFDEVERLLMSRQFATIREGETLLSDLWVRLRQGRLEAALGRRATAEEIRQDLASHPMPRSLDLRMHAQDLTPA